MRVIRIAIWERNKIVIGLAAATWLTNIGFLINSKSDLLMIGTQSQTDVIRTRCSEREQSIPIIEV